MEKLPTGGCEELRAIAIDTARRALQEAGREDAAADPAEIVAILEQNDLPLSTLVSYVHFLPRGRPLTAESFARHCGEFRHDAAKLNYDGSAEPGLCSECHAYPTQRVGAFLVCASGRCAPVVAAS